MTRPGTIGDPLPNTARGHCAFIDRWHVTMCWAPASYHMLIDRPGGSAMFVCSRHHKDAYRAIQPVDEHRVSGDCVHPEAKWQLPSFNHESFCLLPAESADLLLEIKEEVRHG